jgi:hypothetical protein
LARKRDKICSLKEISISAAIFTSFPLYIYRNTCILGGVYDRGQGKGEGPVSAPLICYNPGERVEGVCPEKVVGYYMKNGFGSELFSKKFVFLK